MQIQTNRNQRELKSHGDVSFPILVSHESITSYELNTFSWHWHPEIELTLIEEGEMMYQINGHEMHVQKGDLLFSNCNALHSGHSIDGRACYYWSITFDSKLIYGFENSLIQTKYVDAVVSAKEFSSLLFDGSESWHHDLKELVCELISLSSDKSDFYEIKIQMQLTKIWLMLLEHRTSFSLNENFEKVKIIRDSTYPYAYVNLKVKFSKLGEKKKIIQEINPFIYFEVAKNGEILTKKSRLVTTKHYYSRPDSELWFYLEYRPVENLDTLEKSIVSFFVKLMSDKDSVRLSKIKEESEKKKNESLMGKKIKLTLKEASRNSRKEILGRFGSDIEITLKQVEFFCDSSAKLYLILNDKLALTCEYCYDLCVFSYKIENNQYMLVKKLQDLWYVDFVDLFQETELFKALIEIDNLFERFVKFIEYMYEKKWYKYDEE